MVAILPFVIPHHKIPSEGQIGVSFLSAHSTSFSPFDLKPFDDVVLFVLLFYVFHWL